MKIYIFLLLVFTTPITAQISDKSTAVDTPLYLKNPLYHQEMGLYEIYKTKQADIVMVGNSNIYGADWAELLGRTNVVGRGITSDLLEGYISRLNYVITLNPKVVFISGGLNDIYNWRPVNLIFDDYVFLIEQLRKRGITVVVQSTFNVLSRWPSAETRNPEVDQLNKLLKEYCAAQNIEFLNLTPLFSRNGSFREEYTNPWGHINPKGYKIWGEQVDRLLKKLGL